MEISILETRENGKFLLSILCFEAKQEFLLSISCFVTDKEIISHGQLRKDQADFGDSRWALLWSWYFSKQLTFPTGLSAGTPWRRQTDAALKLKSAKNLKNFLSSSANERCFEAGRRGSLEESVQKLKLKSFSSTSSSPGALWRAARVWRTPSTWRKKMTMRTKQ